MRWWTPASVLAAVAALGGCASNDQARLAREVGGLVHPGMTMQRAESNLQQAGFSCSPDRRGRYCARPVADAVIATCNQRVFLIPDPGGADLASFDVPAIPCASL